MDEYEFDSLQYEPWDRKKSELFDALKAWLWSMSLDQLKWQLLAKSPEIPPGYGLADFVKLKRHADWVVIALKEPQFLWISRSMPVITLGERCFTAFEARCEIIRRAIAFLE